MARRLITPYYASALLACSPGTTSTTDATTVTTGVAQATTTSERGSDSTTTFGSSECPRVIDGDYEVETPEDAVGLAAVSGMLTISLDDDDPTPDLSFLDCLESVGHLYVSGTPALDSIEGMTSLQALDILTVKGAPTLTAIRGADWMREMTMILIGGVESLRAIEFPTLERLNTLSINNAASLETLSFPSLRSVGYINVNSCTEGFAWTPSWTSFDGFPAIEEIDIFHVASLAGMTHLDILDSLLANGGTITGSTQIRYNPMLPETEVLDQLAALGVGVGVGDVCGNLGGAEECSCGIPE